MTGKDKCRILKQIRANIALEHGIDGFEYQECDYVGFCSGTCPACDAEIEKLNSILSERGISVDVFVNADAMMSCQNLDSLSSNDAYNNSQEIIEENYGSPTLAGMGYNGMRLLADFEASGRKGIAFLINNTDNTIQRVDINFGKKRKRYVRGITNNNLRGGIGCDLPNHKDTLVIITEVPQKKRRGLFRMFSKKKDDC